MSQPDPSRAAHHLASYVPILVHEIRTPLTALRGSLGLLKGAVEDATAEVRDYATMADRNAAKLAALLDDVAEYEHLTGGGVEVRPEPVDLADVIERAVEQVQPVADERGVKLEVTSAVGELNADARLLRDVVVRLLTYAVRVSPNASTVCVSCQQKPSDTCEQDAVRSVQTVLDVTDCGRQVDASTAQRIFEPFSPAARRSASQQVRPGLDLAIAHAIATVHGASLTFTTTTEGGKFTLQLE